MNDNLIERKAFADFLLGNYSDVYTQENVDHYIEHNHVSWLAWQARAAIERQSVPAGSLALDAAIGYIERHTPHLVYSEIKAALAAAPQPQPVHDDAAYKEAVSLATALFKKHFAHEDHYASGQVVWSPCDTAAGVISQIDNMVSGLVQPQPVQAPQDGYVRIPTNADEADAMLRIGYAYLQDNAPQRLKKEPQPVQEPEMHQALCPALTGGKCECNSELSVDKAWARFCGGIGRGPDAPYPGMIEAFERHYSQSFTDKAWRTETGVWAAAWKAAKLTAQPAQPLSEADPFTYIIQHLNSSPYALTKDECITKIKELRAIYQGETK